MTDDGKSGRKKGSMLKGMGLATPEGKASPTSSIKMAGEKDAESSEHL